MFQQAVHILGVMGLILIQQHNPQDLIRLFGFLFTVTECNRFEVSTRTKATQEELISTEKQY
jgi:hypothetical protein